MKKISIPLFAACLGLVACSSGSSHLGKGGNKGEFPSWNDIPNLSLKVDSVLNKMTLEEKIGQMSLLSSDWDVTGPSIKSDYENYIRSGQVGNIFNAYTAEFTRKLQKVAMEETRMKIPLLFGYDVIHGQKTIFPIPLGQSASWDMEAIERAARVSANEASAQGIQWTYSPMLDIVRDPRWGRVMESSGEDTYLTSQVAIAQVNGYQGSDLGADSTILACAKHFVAYGAAQAGRDYHTVDISERVLRDVYLPPFKAAVDAGVASIMTSFNEYDGIPVSGNKFLLTDILRQEWNFRGFIVTDYTSINEMVPHGIVSDLKEAVELAVNAGVDMDMQGLGYSQYLQDLIKANKVSMSTIDNAVRYILAMKFRLGLFEDPYRYCNEQREKDVIYSKYNLAEARDMARKSFVLLKNNNVLPLKENLRIAVVGELANSKSDPLGAWRAAGDPAKTVTILDGIKAQAGKNAQVTYNIGASVSGNSRSGFASAVSAARNSDIVILVIGESWEQSGEAASRAFIDIPGVQTELLAELKKTGKPIVTLIMSGRPLVLEQENSLSDAMMEIWYPGTETGNAVADVLFGKYNPSGKLTMTFPLTLGQVPIFYNMKNTGRPISENKYTSKYLDAPNTPLFPFGYGLSYTTFSYSGLKLDKEEMKANSEIKVKVKVSNTGKYDGEEIVQMYIRDLVGSITRPVKELKGFRKVFLKKGETKEIEFTINNEMLSFTRANNTWGSEPGKFQVFVGGSSDKTLESGFVLK